MSAKTYKVEIEGEDKLRAKLNQIAASMRGQVSKEAVHAGGLQVQNNARLNIHSTFSRHQTGGLSNSIKTESKIAGDSAEAEISVNKVYARIQELGGTIVPKKAGGWLVWRDPDSGQVHRARSVTLPKRPYLEPAITEHQSDILTAMEKVIDAYLVTQGE